MTDKPQLKLAPDPVPGTVATAPRFVTAQVRGRRRWRHVLVPLSFVFMVALPTAVAIGYLFTRAADQYHSVTAFSVRSEDFVNPLEALSAFTQVGASSASDSSILYDFIRSQPLIESVDAELDLARIYNRPENDPLFTLGPDPSAEDMTWYWDYAVSTAIDSQSGVIELEVRAFTPEDAQAVVRAVLARCDDLVDDLSRIAREDAMRFAREDLNEAEARLRDIRRRIRTFRVENEIIDPTADAASQFDVISTLQAELTRTLVEKTAIADYSSASDPRIVNLDRRIAAIEKQIAAERAAVAATSRSGRPLSEVIGEYEELLVDMEFSENAYTAARAAEEQARAEARRKSRYIAVHIPPTIAETSLYPRRWLLSALALACLASAWGVLVLIYYNIRDRR